MFYNRKPQSRASYFFGMAFIYPVEPLEHTALVFFWDSNAVILYRNTDIVLIFCKADTDASALFVVLDRIVANIKQHFLQNIGNCVKLYSVPFYIEMNVLLFWQ